MAKNMARLDENNIVINIEWVSDNIEESNNLVNTYDCLVEIEDTYSDGRFYRDGELILTPLESAYNIIDELIKEKEELNESYTEGVNSI